MQNVYILALLAYAAFSITDASVKGAGGQLTIFEIAFIVNVFAGLALLITRHPNEKMARFLAHALSACRPWSRHLRRGGQSLRGLCVHDDPSRP